MDEDEAELILDPHVRRLRKLPYSELLRYMKDIDAFEVTGESGTIYSIEIQAFGTAARRPATFVFWRASMTGASGGAFYLWSPPCAKTS
jgi:hypothetical protein